MMALETDSTQTGGTKRRRLILASRSLRRRQLLDDAGIVHTVRLAQEIDDGDLMPGRVAPVNWVAALAYLKARAVVETLEHGSHDSLVLGADTVCVQDGEIIGQPANRVEAGRTIRLFENDEHEVLTGVAIVDESGTIVDLFVDRAQVCVGAIGDDAIETYLDSEQWRGKAGAYNLFERLEAGWPIEFDGDSTTIVGLPMTALAERLEGLGLSKK